MRFHRRNPKLKGQHEYGHAMSEYIVVSIALVLALIAAISAVDQILEHHERASTAMQLPL